MLGTTKSVIRHSTAAAPKRKLSLLRHVGRRLAFLPRQAAFLGYPEEL